MGVIAWCWESRKRPCPRGFAIADAFAWVSERIGKFWENAESDGFFHRSNRSHGT
jgi:hypothetical protein